MFQDSDYLLPPAFLKPRHKSPIEQRLTSVCLDSCRYLNKLKNDRFMKKSRAEKPLTLSQLESRFYKSISDPTLASEGFSSPAIVLESMSLAERQQKWKLMSTDQKAQKRMDSVTQNALKLQKLCDKESIKQIAIRRQFERLGDTRKP